MMGSLRDGVKARLEAVIAQCEAAEQELSRLHELKAAYEAVLRLDTGDDGKPFNHVNPDGKPVNAHLIVLARRNDGILETREAIAQLVEAGIYESRVDANDGIHTTLRRSKDFEKVGRGIYRHIHRFQDIPNRSAPNIKIADLVEQILRPDPSLTNAQIVDKVRRQGFDFGDKKPAFAVHMAAIHARRRIAEDGNIPVVGGLRGSSDGNLARSGELGSQLQQQDERNSLRV